jgi:hypothetical protein
MYGTAGSSSRRVAWRRSGATASGGGGGGGAVADPRMLPKSVIVASALNDGVNNLANNSLGNVGGAFFWTASVPNAGAVVDTNFTASTYKTIVSITGAGDLCHAIGPTMASAGHTTTMELTVDGAPPITIVFTSDGAARRAVLGLVGVFVSQVMQPPYSLNGASLDSGRRLNLIASDTGLPNPMDVRRQGLPRLRFSSSLLVRMQSSNDITAAFESQRRSGVLYVLD